MRTPRKDSCRKCKEKLNPIDLKEARRPNSRGYLCLGCYKAQTKYYNDKKRNAQKEWRKLYG